MAFKKAVKSQSKLRAAMFGPSGAGKTYSALAIASGMGSKIALIDSEHSSASKYADRFEFDQVNLDSKSIGEYVAYIKEAAASDYDVLIIDSLSHAWQTLIESIDKLANAKFRGNTWAAWSEGTPEQRKLVEAITSFPGHIIATMRSKTEWQTSNGDGSKKTGPVRVGLAPEQGKGIEYEFDILFEISPEHLAHIIKDRTGKFQDKIIEKPGVEFGKQLVAWLNEGVPDMRSLCLTKLKEIGVILKSNPNGFANFSESEIENVRIMIKNLDGNTDEERLTELERILEELKEELKNRMAAKENTAAAGVMVPATSPPKPARWEFQDDIPGPVPGKTGKQTARERGAELDIF